MSNPFLAEIRILGCNFAPKGWALCDGQILPLSQNTALFSLLGTTYGGDGKSNFALPNLQGLTPMAFGQGSGRSFRDLGETGGEETVTLLQTETPAHTHTLQAGVLPSPLKTPTNARVISRSAGANAYAPGTSSSLEQFSDQALAPTGGNQPHNNLVPYLVLNFCIALQGVYPPRT